MPKQKRFSVEKVLSEFQTEEQSSSHRKGLFKIEKPFEEAVDTILKSRLAHKKAKPKP